MRQMGLELIGGPRGQTYGSGYFGPPRSPLHSPRYALAGIPPGRVYRADQRSDPCQYQIPLLGRLDSAGGHFVATDIWGYRPRPDDRSGPPFRLPTGRRWIYTTEWIVIHCANLTRI